MLEGPARHRVTKAPTLQSRTPVPPPAQTSVGAAEELIQLFYSQQKWSVSDDQIEADKTILADLEASGYSRDAIQSANRWTVRNIPSARQFKMVKLCIAEALDQRGELDTAAVT